MNMMKTLTVGMISVVLAGCGTMKEMKNKDIAIEFDQSAKGYNRMVRWHELDGAETAYVPPGLRDEYRKRVIDAAEVKIVDYRVKSMECSPVKGEGSAWVEFDFYRPPSVTLHTIEDRQKWAYEGTEGNRAWHLTTLLPEFK
jgi:hypothetical protein